MVAEKVYFINKKNKKNWIEAFKSRIGVHVHPKTENVEILAGVKIFFSKKISSRLVDCLQALSATTSPQLEPMCTVSAPTLAKLLKNDPLTDMYIMAWARLWRTKSGQ